jgi:hypothetical protein
MVLISFLTLPDHIALVKTSSILKLTLNHEFVWAAQTKLRFPHAEHKPIELSHRKWYEMQLSRMYSPVLQLLDQLVPFQVLFRRRLDPFLSFVNSPPQRVNEVLRQSSTLRRRFRERQQAVRMALELHNSLGSVPSMLLQLLVVLGCLVLRPGFFQYPYDKFYFSLNDALFRRLILFAALVLGFLPGLISVILAGPVFVTNSVSLWLTLDQVIFRVVKELRVRYLTLCVLMVIMVLLDICATWGNAFLQIMYFFDVLIRPHRYGRVTSGSIIMNVVKVVLSLLLLRVHWFLEICQAIGSLFHVFTLNAYQDKLQGTPQVKGLFAAALLLTISFPSLHYYRLLNHRRGYVRVTQLNMLGHIATWKFAVGYTFSLVDAFLMVHIMFNYGLFSSILAGIIVSLCTSITQLIFSKILRYSLTKRFSRRRSSSFSESV